MGKFEKISMKKLLCGVLAGSVLAGSFLAAGCARSAGAAKAELAFTEPQYTWDKSSAKLVVWSREQEASRVYLRRGFERYEELTGGELEIVTFTNEEFEKRLAAAFSGEEEKPDIILSYGGTNIESCMPDENFYDFTDAPWVDDLTSTSINQTVYNGKIIGLPHWEASISGTLYNKKLFKKYGISVPRNQEEFMQVCETLKEHGIIPLYLPGKEISMTLYQFALDTLISDSDTLDALNDGRLSYTTLPGMEQLVEWYRTMAAHGYFGEHYLEDDWGGMDEALKSGKYGMMLCWDTWLYTDFTGNPKNFGLMPAFSGGPDQGTFEGPNLALLIVNKNSPRLEDALNFITFMADPYNYNAAFEGIYTASVFKNQSMSIATPQYIEAERLIERQYHDSTAWLRIRGFSQMDAVCILDYMSEKIPTARECLKQMDILRRERMSRLTEKP